jgi:hypothetical protein
MQDVPRTLSLPGARSKKTSALAPLPAMHRAFDFTQQVSLHGLWYCSVLGWPEPKYREATWPREIQESSGQVEDTGNSGSLRPLARERQKLQWARDPAPPGGPGSRSPRSHFKPTWLGQARLEDTSSTCDSRSLGSKPFVAYDNPSTLGSRLPQG